MNQSKMPIRTGQITEPEVGGTGGVSFGVAARVGTRFARAASTGELGVASLAVLAGMPW